MGAKCWMLVYSNGNAAEILQSRPKLDRQKSAEFVQQLFPAARFETIDDGNLAYNCCPRGKDIYIGCFPKLSIVAAKEFGIDYPSKLPASFLNINYGKTVYLHAMHSVVDWFAYAIWENGKLIRSLSLAPDNGVIEDIGVRREFERPYWSGDHPVFEPGEEDQSYPFAFHPLDLGDAALLDMFGYQIEGYEESSYIDPEEIPLIGFKRKRSGQWYKFW